MSTTHKTARLTLSDDSRTRATASLMRFADAHFDEPISDLQASLLLDHVLIEIAPSIYNQALIDARRYVEERAADLEASLYKAEFPQSARGARR